MITKSNNLDINNYMCPYCGKICKHHNLVSGDLFEHLHFECHSCNEYFRYFKYLTFSARAPNSSIYEIDSFTCYQYHVSASFIDHGIFYIRKRNNHSTINKIPRFEIDNLSKDQLKNKIVTYLLYS